MSRPMSDDEALQMLAGAHFGPNSGLVLPSGRRLSPDEANVFTSLYAADRLADVERGEHLAPPEISATMSAEDVDRLLRLVASLRAERDELRAEVARLHRPLWRRLFGGQR